MMAKNIPSIQVIKNSINTKYIVLVLFCVFLNYTGYSQNDKLTIEEVFQKVKETYESKSKYAFNVKYELFKDHQTIEVTEFYTGKVIKDQGELYSKIKNTEFIQLNEAYLKINHDEKAMLYTEQALNEQTHQLVDLTAFLSYFEKTSVSLNKDIYICELTSKNISLLPYSKVVTYINADDFTIKKQLLYLLNPSVFKESNGKSVTSNPRLEITFSNFNSQNINSANTFSLLKYISISNNEIKPSNNLKAYQLINATKN